MHKPWIKMKKLVQKTHKPSMKIKELGQKRHNYFWNVLKDRIIEIRIRQGLPVVIR